MTEWSAGSGGQITISTPAVVLKHTLDVITEGSLITDASRMIVYANLAFSRITGYGIEEIRGHDCGFLQGAGTDPSTVARIHEALENGDEFRGDILNYRKDGSPFWNSLIIHPVTDSVGEITHFVSVQRDIRDEIDEELGLERVLYESESRRQTAEALLEFALSLTSWATGHAVSTAAAEAILTVAGADSSVVALRNDDESPFVIASAAHRRASATAVDLVDSVQLSQVADLLGAEPVAIVDRSSSPEARSLLQSLGAEAVVAASIPTTGHGGGILVGCWSSGPPRAASAETLKTRTSGLATLTGSALRRVS